MSLSSLLGPGTSSNDPVAAELEKDIGDVRHLPGVHYEAHQSAHLLNFTKIPNAFRPLLKQYVRLLLTRCTLSGCRDDLFHLQLFFLWYASVSPGARTLRDLTRAGIERYLLHLQTRTNRYGRPTSDEQRWRAMHALRVFLEYLERVSAARPYITSEQIGLARRWQELSPADPQQN